MSLRPETKATLVEVLEIFNPLPLPIPLLTLASAVLGVVLIVIGLGACFVDLSGILNEVLTTSDKIQFVVFGALLAVFGIGFGWLWQRGRIVAALLLIGALAVLFMQFVALGVDSGLFRSSD